MQCVTQTHRLPGNHVDVSAGQVDTAGMGTVHKFRRPPKNKGQFRGQPPKRPGPGKRRLRRPWWLREKVLALAILGLAAGAAAGSTIWSSIAGDGGPSFTCSSPDVLDGDTIDCGSTRVRLSGIDAPELPGHCRPGRICTPGDPYASTANLRAVIGEQTLTCRQSETDVYGRAIARCTAGEQDLSCAQIDGGFAVRRYGWIWC